ncbi:MAG: winged helix-turn-helix domain-containing protein [Vicinamibacterales bacterium]
MEWFRALLDTAPDVYFRYALIPAPGFVYLSPSVQTLTSHTSDEFLSDPSLCVTLVPRPDRRILRQVLRARRALTVTLGVLNRGASIPIELRTVPVIHRRQVVAVEGVARLLSSTSALAPPASSPEPPTQQRLAALMYEVHDLLHRVLPPAAVAGRSERVVRVGDLAFDPERLAVTEAGAPVALTSRELLVLRYFLQRPDHVVTRTQLLEDVWGHLYTGDDRTVDVHVSRLRKKLPSLRSRLEAIKHVGYRLALESEAKIANF